MSRTYLTEARRKAHLTQAELASNIGFERKTIVRLEAGTHHPTAFQEQKIREILNNQDENLFTCTTRQNHGIVDSNMHTQELARGFKDIMDKARRQFIATMSQCSGAAFFGEVGLALVSLPVIQPEEYLAQVTMSLDLCWHALGQGNFERIERALNVYTPTLTHIASILSPVQGVAASLVVQAKIMQLMVTTQQMHDTYATRELICLEAVRFAHLSGDRNMLGAALDYLATTYTFCRKEPEKAIPLLHQALSSFDSPAGKSNVHMDLAIAYAQQGAEQNAREHAELAHVLMPTYPQVDSLHHCLFGPAELDQQEGKIYLYLANHFPDSNYGELAYDAFEQSVRKPAKNKALQSRALIRKADAACLINEMHEFASCLEQGHHIAVDIQSKRRVRDAHSVMQRIPLKWQKEHSIQNLQKELAQ